MRRQVHEQRRRRQARGKRRRFTGQAMVEFTFVSFIFLFILLGTIDFGRAVFTYAELHNAVREGARYARVHPSDSSGTKTTVVSAINGFTLTTSAVTVSCTGTCTTGSNVTVSATYKFSAVAQTLLKLSPITLTASATDAVD